MLKIDKQQLLSLLKDFYKLTGVKIAILDDEGVECYNVPERHCGFCAYVRTSPAGQAACEQCDRQAMEICRRTGKLYLYTCHMGLAECYSPIMQQGKCIGYIACGQSRTGKEEKDALRVRAAEYGLDGEKLLSLYSEIGQTQEENMHAAAAIMDACASYLYLNRLIEAGESMSGEIAKYVDENLSGDLSVDALCRNFHLSRVDLYACCKEAFSATPALYVRHARLRRAAELLKETSLPVAEIAAKVGLYDYNYFSKLFRARYSLSPRAYRKKFAPK